jgi:transcription antitermination factor NusA-like protein
LVRQEGMGGYAGKAGIEVVGECIGAAKARVRELSEKLYGQ